MKKSSIEAVKKQWFTSIILILFAVWIVINPAGGFNEANDTYIFTFLFTR